MKESLADNATISHYRILSLLGAGGMGIYGRFTEGLSTDDLRDARVLLNELEE